MEGAAHKGSTRPGRRAFSCGESPALPRGACAAAQGTCTCTCTCILRHLQPLEERVLDDRAAKAVEALEAVEQP